MMTRPTTYDLTSRINHWLVAIVVIGMLGAGLLFEFGGLERDVKGPLVNIHKAVGVLVMVFGLWRVLWRLRQGFPEPVSIMPTWQERASKWSHWLLLAGIIIMPVSGLVSTIIGGYPIVMFGLFEIPPLAKIEWLGSIGSSVHGYAGKALAILVVLHIAAALKHHFRDSDKTLTRMVKG